MYINLNIYIHIPGKPVTEFSFILCGALFSWRVAVLFCSNFVKSLYMGTHRVVIFMIALLTKTWGAVVLYTYLLNFGFRDIQPWPEL